MPSSDRKLILDESAQVFGTDISATTPSAIEPMNRPASAGVEDDSFQKFDVVFGKGDAVKALPATAPPGKTAPPAAKPAAMPSPALTQDRQQEISRIQSELVNRRRRRLGILLAKLAFFVVLPTLLTGIYFYRFATPLFETHSEFVIQKASPGASATAVTGLFSGTSLGTSQDSIIVQGFLTSREAMLRLDGELGFKGHFSAATIDPLLRLQPDSSDEDAYGIYRKKIAVGFDPSEGILRMSVAAASAEDSQEFAEALIRYAEQRVDQISQRARKDQMAGTQESYDEAEANLKSAQLRLVELQQLRGVLSTEVEVTSQMSIINSLELELERKKLELQEIQSNPQPNQTRADLTGAEIDRIAARIQILRAQMTNSSDSSASLAKIAGELQLAQSDVATRQLLLQQALSHMESAREEANRQTRYLAIGVAPIAPDKATLPRKFESTALSFVIFAGLYLLVSLTVSILREQVSV